MGLSHFHAQEKDNDPDKGLEGERKKRRDKNFYQKNLALDQRKDLFNKLSLENKKRCLLDIDKKQPVTPGELEDTWWNKKGKRLSDEEIQKIKKETALFSKPDKYCCWKRTTDRLLLLEFDNDFKETGKKFAVVAESNDLAILVKGEEFLRRYGLITYDALRNRGK